MCRLESWELEVGMFVLARNDVPSPNKQPSCGVNWGMFWRSVGFWPLPCRSSSPLLLGIDDFQFMRLVNLLKPVIEYLSIQQNHRPFINN